MVAWLFSFAEDCSLFVLVGDETFPDLALLGDFAVERENPKILDFTSLAIMSNTEKIDVFSHLISIISDV